MEGAVPTSPTSWSVERVEALAPDPSSFSAARRLATPGPWQDAGWQEDLLWGSCQGSGKRLYSVSVDTADASSPACKCSCPSRKYPCKHALALLLLWVQAQVGEVSKDDGAPPSFASAWASARQARRSGPVAPRERETTQERRTAAARRAARREERVSAGLAELDRFLADQLQEGLATHAVERPQRLDHMAARMVDAQAPGVASRLRELATVPSSGDDWPRRVIEELGSLHLLAAAWAGRDHLPRDLVATVRSHVGLSLRTEEVLAQPGVADRWVVLGVYDTAEEQVTVRRTWLWGRETGLPALVLSFFRDSPRDAAHDRARPGEGLVPGCQVDAELHFYPGQPRLRAAVGRRRGQLPRVEGWRGADVHGRVSEVADAVARLREALACDPWLETWPVAVHGTLAWQDGGAWLVAGTGLAMTGPESLHWSLLAQAGTGPATVFGVLSAAGLRPLAFLDEGTVRPL